MHFFGLHLSFVASILILGADCSSNLVESTAMESSLSLISMMVSIAII